ncbi:MAG: hypothetical protein C0593_01985 [Marinilabiliales bacterium]|nr:MAG: hypothetical protein C0593_01985 [Marinilabiliales bacterium]
MEGLDGSGVEGLLSNLEGNIDNDPIFEISGEFPYALSESSPCIDTGKEDLSNMEIPSTDLLNHFRVWDGNGDQNAIIDMGAYEYGSSGMGIINNNFISGISLSPNPAKNYIGISHNTLFPSQTITITVYSMDGSIVKSVIKHPEYSNSSFLIEVSSLSSGAYIIHCQSGKAILGNKKFIKY